MQRIVNIAKIAKKNKKSENIAKMSRNPKKE